MIRRPRGPLFHLRPSMGRETKFLLALLGLLAGVFLGVVSMKLFVPRPPAGAGPDVHADIATAEAQALVEPPELNPATAPADAIAMAHVLHYGVLGLPAIRRQARAHGLKVRPA